MVIYNIACAYGYNDLVGVSGLGRTRKEAEAHALAKMRRLGAGWRVLSRASLLDLAAMVQAQLERDWVRSYSENIAAM